MSDEYGYAEKRRKGKDKYRDKKRHPYRKGGKHRSDNLSSSLGEGR